MQKIKNIIFFDRLEQSPGRVYKVLHYVLGFFLITLSAAGLGIAVLLIGARTIGLDMMLSYFTVDWLVFLNILPVLIIMLFLYFAVNRVWIAVLAGSLLTFIPALINYFKLNARNDPLLMSDIALVTEAANIGAGYTYNFDRTLIISVAGIAVMTAVCALLGRAKIKRGLVRIIALPVTAAIAAALFFGVYLSDAVYEGLSNTGLINVWSDTQQYISRGFVYSFLNSSKNLGDAPPEGYSEEEAIAMLGGYEYRDMPEEKKVNVIAIMLEAYNDFRKFDSLEINDLVYEALDEALGDCVKGELVTNIFAGGTIDTEWCFLTGASDIDSFRRDVRTYVNYFAGQGYYCEASHPGYAWFYNRQNVYEYFGFEESYFYENYFEPLSESAYVYDFVYLPEVLSFYEAAKEKDQPYFGFGVTYQNHGPYGSAKTYDISYVADKGYSDETYNILNNYFAGISTTNYNLAEMIKTLSGDDEPVVVVLFGDHNPWLGDANSAYIEAGIDFDTSTAAGFYNYYSTPYYIWANDAAKEAVGNGFSGDGGSFSPCFLMNKLFELLGVGGDEFMQLSNELFDSADIIHTTGMLREDGELVWELSPASEELRRRFMYAQYYRQTY